MSVIYSEHYDALPYSMYSWLKECCLFYGDILGISVIHLKVHMKLFIYSELGHTLIYIVYLGLAYAFLEKKKHTHTCRSKGAHTHAHTHTIVSTLIKKKGKLTQDILIIRLLIHFVYCYTKWRTICSFIFLQYSIPAMFFRPYIIQRNELKDWGLIAKVSKTITPKAQQWVRIAKKEKELPAPTLAYSSITSSWTVMFGCLCGDDLHVYVLAAVSSWIRSVKWVCGNRSATEKCAQDLGQDTVYHQHVNFIWIWSTMKRWFEKLYKLSVTTDLDTPLRTKRTNTLWTWDTPPPLLIVTHKV